MDISVIVNNGDENMCEATVFPSSRVILLMLSRMHKDLLRASGFGVVEKESALEENQGERIQPMAAVHSPIVASPEVRGSYLGEESDTIQTNRIEDHDGTL
ncbi:hypothetical protein B7463_g187, partial [Scytalidium lignicola]